MSLLGRHVATSSSPARRFVVFTIGGVRFAMQADFLRGLLRPEEAGSIGALTVHGQTYVAADLSTAFNCPWMPTGPTAGSSCSPKRSVE